jgi:hypothetical protein
LLWRVRFLIVILIATESAKKAQRQTQRGAR